MEPRIISNNKSDPFFDFYLKRKEIEQIMIDTTFKYFNLMLFNCNQKINYKDVNKISKIDNILPLIEQINTNVQSKNIENIKTSLNSLNDLKFFNFESLNDTLIKILIESYLDYNKIKTNDFSAEIKNLFKKYSPNTLTNTPKINTSSKTNKNTVSIFTNLIEFINEINKNQKQIDNLINDIKTFNVNNKTEKYKIQSDSTHAKLLIEKLNQEVLSLRKNYDDIFSSTNINFVFSYIRAIISYYKIIINTYEYTFFIAPPAPPPSPPIPQTPQSGGKKTIKKQKKNIKK